MKVRKTHKRRLRKSTHNPSVYLPQVQEKSELLSGLPTDEALTGEIINTPKLIHEQEFFAQADRKKNWEGSAIEAHTVDKKHSKK
jgi:hypothetical protein